MRQGAIYARVSTRRQEKEATIDSQIARLMAYAKEQEIEIPADYQFIDQAVSGAQLARPGLDGLRDQVQMGGIEVVLCLSPDRLARQLGAQQVIVDELKRAGVKLQSINQSEWSTEIFYLSLDVPDLKNGYILIRLALIYRGRAIPVGCIPFFTVLTNSGIK